MDPAQNHQRNVEAREVLYRTLSENLELRWENCAPALEAASFGGGPRRNLQRDFSFPDLREDPDVVLPGAEALGFISPPAVLREQHFFSMFKHGRLPDLSAYDSLRPQHPSVENDLLWGMMNPACAKALLCMASHIRPVNALVIGGGVGYIEALLAQALPVEAMLTVVDCGDATERLKYPIPARGETYRRLLDGGNLFRFINEAFDREYIGIENGRAIVEVVQADSRRFFEQATKHRRQYDFVVIDGNNAFMNGTLDILEGFESLTPGGILIADDSNRLFAQSGVMRAAFALDEAGVSVLTLEARGNSTLCDRHGNPPNMLIAAKRPDWRHEPERSGQANLWALRASIAAEMRDLEDPRR